MSGFEIIIGRNPVREAIAAGRGVNKILASAGPTDRTLATLLAQARDKGINVQLTDRRRLDALAEGASHQGVVAYVSPVRFVEPSDLLDIAARSGTKAFFVMLDGITDPHNTGAIIRSAYCAGAHGVIVAKRRSSAMNETVDKTSAGAASHLPICQVSNLAQTIEYLKKNGVFAVAADTEGQDCFEADFDLPCVLVIGSEGSGVGRLIGERCDFRVNIPMKGGIGSLNASVAAGVIMFQIARARRQA